MKAVRDTGICIDTLCNWPNGTGMRLGQASRYNRERECIRELEAEISTLREQPGEQEEVIDIQESMGILSKP